MTKPDTTYQPLGNFIRKVDNRNRDLKVKNLVGLTIEKAFIPSVANIIGTDLSNYKVIRKRQFACSLMQVSRDGKMPVAMFAEEEGIMSPAYPMFEVADEKVLLPEYLMMWFARSEFDREASYYAVGGVRGSLEWDDFCAMRIPVPPIAEQRAIVAEYAAVQHRMEVNKRLIAKLEETAQTLYKKMFVDGVDKENLPDGWRMGTLGEVATVKSGYAFQSNWWTNFGIPVIKIGDIENRTINKKSCDCVNEDKFEYAKNFVTKKGDLVIAMTGATLGKIAIVPQNGFLVNQRVGLFNLGEKPIEKAAFLYILLLQPETQKEILTVGGDSAQANVSNSNIENIEFPMPPTQLLESYNKKCAPIINQIILAQQEIEKLKELLSLLLARIGR